MKDNIRRVCLLSLVFTTMVIKYLLKYFIVLLVTTANLNENDQHFLLTNFNYQWGICQQVFRRFFPWLHEIEAGFQVTGIK